MAEKVSLCHCSRTKCLKMYCECFAKGFKCGKECGCIGCSNVDENSDQVEKARSDILKRNP